MIVKWQVYKQLFFGWVGGGRGRGWIFWSVLVSAFCHFPLSLSLVWGGYMFGYLSLEIQYCYDFLKDGKARENSILSFCTKYFKLDICGFRCEFCMDCVMYVFIFAINYFLTVFAGFLGSNCNRV